jgi:ketosteroid isomerase-like protein
VSDDDGRTWQPLYELEYRPAAEALDRVPCTAPADLEAEAGALATATGIIEADNQAAIERVLSFYAERPVLLPRGEAPVAGLAEVRRRYARLFAEFAPAIESRVDRVCIGEGGVAFVEGNNGGGLRRRDGGPPRVLDDSYFMVLRRDDASRWRITHLAWW